MHAETGNCPDTLNFTVRTLDGEQQVNLCEAYGGKVVLIVNTASKCAFTSQYEGLEALYKTYKDRGLIVLGFPSNDFANQEPGTEAEIKTFCRMTYGVQFPMFAKTRVRKNNADPLYQKLGETAGSWPKWNFHKYLLDREGQLVGSYGSFTGPQSKKLIRQIESLL
ncbi:MAG: glutathione peroxidase [Thiohalomonadales bacterium]|nr:glutathione peroxidase [Thiohalomonadales bacterium]